MSLYYRVGTDDTAQGLWYTPDGKFTGHIHTRYEWLQASALQMPFDPELVGWLSATTSLEELFQWFTREEILTLQDIGYYIYVYEATHIKYYRPYEHWVIQQESSRIVGKLILQ